MLSGPHRYKRKKGGAKKREKKPKPVLTGPAYQPDSLIDIVVRIDRVHLFDSIKCTIILRLASKRSTFGAGFQIDKSPQRTDLAPPSTDPVFKKNSFCFRVPAVTRGCQEKFVMRLFKIDTARRRRSVAGVGVIPLGKAAKHLLKRQKHKFKTKFKYGKKGNLVDIGVVHLTVNLL